MAISVAFFSKSPMNFTAFFTEFFTFLESETFPFPNFSKINTLPVPEHGVRLLIGPEGGLSSDEIARTVQEDFKEMLLGPRVLRTETAALTAITALQCRFGDLA